MKMDQKWFFGRNTAILNVTDNIPANTKALPKLTLRKIKGFSHSPDSVVHAIAPPFPAGEAIRIFKGLRPEFQDYALDQIRKLAELQMKDK